MIRRTLDPTAIPLLGTQVIEASAGTGKTYTITSLLVRLVTEGRLGIEQVLAVTFTNAAAAELEGRIRQRVTAVQAALHAGESRGDEVAEHLLKRPDLDELVRRLDRAAHEVDRAAVTTIHGFCARALSEYALSAGTRPDTTLLGDDRGVLYDVVTDFWSSQVATLPVADFRALRGDSLHAELAQVAKGVVNAPGVPLDRATEPMPDGGVLTRYAAHFNATRAQFLEEGPGLLAALLSAHGLNKTSYSEPILRRDFGNLDGYFQMGELDPGSYPDLDKGLFTSERVSRSAKKGHVAPTHPLLDVLQVHREHCEQAARLTEQRREALLRRLAGEIEARLEREHTRLRTQSFDGLLRSLAKGLSAGPSGQDLAAAIRRRFPTLLIDEFQDTDPIQYRVFRQIYQPAGAQPASGSALFFIGDPKQSIYRFRGADVSTYLSAAGEAAESVWTLETNWRSGPALVRAQNALFGLHPRPFGGSAIHYQPVRPAPGRDDLLRSSDGSILPGLRIVRTGDVDTMRLVAAEVTRLLTSGLLLSGRAVSPRDVAVLTRTNAQAEEVQAGLRLLGVPAVMHGDRSVFEAPEAPELRRVLRAWLEPGQRSLVYAALATRLVGRTASDMALLGTDADAFEREMESIRRYGATWRHRGIAVALETLFSEVELPPRTLADVDGERRMTNFRHLLELLHQAEVDRHLGMVGLLRFLETAIAAPTGHEMAAEARQVRLESDDDAVTLTTVHKSKGLEYGIVFLPQIGRAERRNFRSSPVARYHDPARDGREFLHVGDDPAAHDLARQEDRTEALRLGYVGLTRAKHQVVAFIEEDRGFSALAWYLHAGSMVGVEVMDSDSWKQLSDATIERDYAALLERGAGTVVVDVAEGIEAPRYERASQARSAVVPPALVKAPVTQQRTSSFSAMTRAKAPLSRAEREGKDLDRVAGASALPAEGAGARGEVIFLDEFPRGAGPGDALHAILERYPFAGGTPEARRTLVERELGRRGFEPAHAARLEQSLAAALEVPLTPSGVRLADLEAKDCARELEFSLPVWPRSEDRGLLSAAALEHCLAPHAGAPAGAFLNLEYTRTLGQLDFPEFVGFLRGFLDLVFFKQGQIFVLDYKSNHLGSHYEDYERARLQTAMESHHYLLQGLLYGVATHRYAKRRIPGYTYGQHFGGVAYLFLRGVAPEAQAEPGSGTAPGTGVYFFRPSEELIEGLSLLLGHQEAP